jgi:hypothetical protein
VMRKIKQINKEQIWNATCTLLEWVWWGVFAYWAYWTIDNYLTYYALTN